MFTCQFCRNSFTRKYNLVRHQMKYCKKSAENDVSAHDTESDREDEKLSNLAMCHLAMLL